MTDTLEIHHVVPRVHAEASGLTNYVLQLCEALQRVGAHPHLHTLRKREGADYPFPVHTYPAWSIPERLGVAPAMRRSLSGLAHRPVIMHNHGLWMMPNIYPGMVRKGGACKLMVSPHGSLSSWALGHSRWKKKAAWWLGQRRLLERADCFHATVEAEYEDIRRLGYRQPVAIIPYVLDLSYAERPLATRPGPQRRLLFLARLHPKKGVDLLLEAWRQLQAEFPDWELVIAGPEDYAGYVEKLQQLIQSQALERVRMAGPVYGKAKEDLFFDADLYVLPTHSENFGISVAEALLAGVPAVVTRGAPWEGLQTYGCGWWIDRKPEALVRTLRQAMRLEPGERAAMGERGRTWIVRSFGWARIVQQMRQTYAWMLGRGERPDWVV